jgi:hypothetical protein
MQRTIYLLAAMALLLTGCTKNNQDDVHRWGIELTDGSSNYTMRGIHNLKRVYSIDFVYLDAQSIFHRNNPTGPVTSVSFSTILSDNNGNSPLLKGFALGVFSNNSALLQQLDPAVNSVPVRQTALQQWLNGQTFGTGSSNGNFTVRYTDPNNKVWQLDSLSTASVTFANVAPYDEAGYGPCVRASLRFTMGQMANYTNTPPYTVLGRQNVSGTMETFFVLP